MYRRMLAHIRGCLPEEGCGLLAVDSTGLVKRHFPVENILHRVDHYQLNPTQQVRAMLWMDRHPARQMIIYHSHPAGPDHLSTTDLAECRYPEAIYWLWYPHPCGWAARIYRFLEGIPTEIQLVVY
jgi:proteasome lid subunit RPN8/RPN11